jgi:hypothetical protein
MDNVKFFILQENGVEVEHALIDHGNEEFTSMPKSEYDRRQANQFTPTIEVTND